MKWSIRIKDLIKRLIFKFIKPEQHLIYNSFSQAGEDSILNFLFVQKKITKISYLEIGSSYPDHLNNTYKFYLEGSKGVLVEADPEMIPRIKKMRPRDKVLNLGVGPVEIDAADFFIFKIQGYNTFSREDAKLRESIGLQKIIKTRKINVTTLQSVIKNHFDSCPDFLSIDIEGLDEQVLRSLNYKLYPIPVICAETCSYSESHIKTKNQSLIQFMLDNGYFVYADTYINTIFVNEKWFQSVN